ncbi:hypothetical protein DM860_008881 [Cuscuta australis]|uniref:DEK-C domain-containing protein n=1 Tax=Cuscuta australis TaxID=267555 RepID=A0A328DBG4_9ASTE|nr:hypothetical protein DM860_008881 [Cuscuta australis]
MVAVKESAEEVEHFPQEEEDKSEEAGSGEEEEEEQEEDEDEGSEKPEEEEEVKGGETRDLKEKKGKRISEPSTPVTPSSSSLRPTRERKSVDRFYAVSSAAKPLSIQKGPGMQLRDIPNVAYKLSKRKPDENLQILHNILYGKKAKARNLKKNIGQFSGYAWAEDELEKQRGRLRDKFDKCVKEKLLDFCDLLNVPAYKSSTKKEELTLKLLEFLVSPHITTDKLLADKEKKRKNQRGKVTKAKCSIDATADIPAKKPEGKAGRKRKQSSEREDAESSPPRSESEEEDGDDANDNKDQKETISEDDDMELEGGEEYSKEKKRKNQRGKVTKTKRLIDATADSPAKKPEGKAGRKQKQSSERQDAKSSPPRSESEEEDDDDANGKKDQKETIPEDDDMKLEGAEESSKEKKRKNQRGKVTKTKRSIDATADSPAKKPEGKAGRKRKQSSEREDTESSPPSSESEEEDDVDANDKKDQKETICEDNDMEVEGAEESSEEDHNSPMKDYGTSTQHKDISVKPSKISDTPTKESSGSTLKRGDDPSTNPEVEISKRQKTATDSGGEDQNASAAEKASHKRKLSGKEKNAKVEKPEPSKEEIYAAAVDILKGANFDTATLNDIIRQLGCQFGVDFKARKAEVKAIITEAINDMSGDEEDEDGDDESAELKS